MSVPLAVVLLVLQSAWTVLDDTDLGILALDEPGLDLVLGLAIGQRRPNDVRSSQRNSRR